MKKEFLIFFAGILLVLSTFSTSYTQSTNSTPKLSWQSSASEKFISSFGEINQAVDSGSIRLNERNSRAVRKFIREYKNVPDVKWSKSADGSNVAYFASDSIITWVFYSIKGNYLGQGRYYTEEKLPSDIRHRVKSTYYDFNIYHITEVVWDDKLVYVVHIKDNRSKDTIFYKIIRIVDGREMEVVREYSVKLNEED